MNTPRNDRILCGLFQCAANSQSDAASPHVAGDEQLLLRWVEGELTANEHAAVLDHMAGCRACREEISMMLHAGALALPDIEPAQIGDTEEGEHDDQLVVQPAGRAIWTRPVLTWATLAAAALVLVGLFVWPPSRSGTEVALAQAERDLAAGNAGAAMDRVEGLLDKSLDPLTRQRAVSLLKQSGYNVARNKLVQGDFTAVVELEHQLAHRTGPAPKMINLRLQAERGIPSEYALAWHGKLTDYRFKSDDPLIKDFSTKRFAPPDPATRRLERELQQALADHPGEVGLMLNYGQFLLDHARPEEARKQFEAVLAKDQDNALARLGLGLAQFAAENYQAALASFETVLRDEPDNVPAHINAAMCCERLDRPGEARAYRRRAAELTGRP